MLIRVDSSGGLKLEGAEDFGRFSVNIDPRAGALAETALSRIGRLEGTGYVWIRPDALRDIAPQAGQHEWEEGFSRMLDYAAERGWLDPHGAIRAHVENAEIMTRTNLMSPPAVDGEEFREAMRNLAGGVAVVATGEGADRRGLTVTAVTSVSVEPPCLLICVNQSSASHDAILANGVFSVSLLGGGDEDLAMRFAGRGGISASERFDGGDWRAGATGAPYLHAAICSMDCKVLLHQGVGSHGIFVGQVIATRQGEGDPLVNHKGQLKALASN